MKNNQNLTIAILSVCAAVLLTLVIATHMDSGKSFGAASVNQETYRGLRMVEGRYDPVTDLVYVIDESARRLNVYYCNRTKPGAHVMELVDSVNLDQVF